MSQILFDGNTGWSVNYLRDTYVENKNLTYDVVGAGFLRMVDAVIVSRLMKFRDTASLESVHVNASKPIYTLSFIDEHNVRHFVDVDGSNGLLLRSSNTKEPGKGRDYIFAKHEKVQGLMFAMDMNLFSEGNPSFITISRKISVNNVKAADFALPNRSKKLRGFIDTKQMGVHELAHDVYLVGQGSRFSIFVRHEDYFVGGGGLGGIKERLKAVNTHLNADMPIHTQVLPDHHRGHLAGIKDLEEMGSEIIVAPPAY